ncbi:MAG: phosphoribosylformylglycinamidine synthase subunit PurQ, partial [Paludibacteraceae bacterium]|nr:phosphoribosylformylglycinamidine synthase subunit PurQ [Paludibacteraceae bacterium]
VKKVVTPVLVNDEDTALIHIDFSFDKHKLGGSILGQILKRLGDDVPTVKYPEYFRETFNAVQSLINDGLILAGHDISAGGLLTTMLEMCFANEKGGLMINLSGINEQDLTKILFAENPGILIQVKDVNKVVSRLDQDGIGYAIIGVPTTEKRTIVIKRDNDTLTFDIDSLRDKWFRTSYLLDRKQSGENCAKARFENYKKQPLQMEFVESFSGQMKQYGITPDRNQKSGIKAAIIREKGTNGEREMAYAMYLAGFDVKDVHMTDLASGRETLEDINFIVFCGGFSNSDVLGSAKGWAGGFLYNEKAKKALENFYARPDTLSLGICNGCQLMVELNLLNPEHDERPRMLHNDSHKFESQFVGLTIPQNESVLFGSLSGSKLGVWVAHGEGKFFLPKDEKEYNIIAKYTYAEYPANPNGSDYAVAGICSKDGRHLAMMPHLERAIFPWQWAHYPLNRKATDEVTPWIEAFVNAKKWIIENAK